MPVGLSVEPPSGIFEPRAFSAALSSVDFLMLSRNPGSMKSPRSALLLPIEPISGTM